MVKHEIVIVNSEVEPPGNSYQVNSVLTSRVTLVCVYNTVSSGGWKLSLVSCCSQDASPHFNNVDET